MGRPNPPRDYCKKLLPVAIDEIASREPHRPWASLPVDDWDLAQGFEDVSFAALANGINKVAHVIEAAFGRSSTFETFAYLGVPDVRYHLVQMAAIKTGYKVLLSSPLNSTNVHTLLMEKTQCVALLSANGALVDDILRAHPVKHALIPELDDLLSLQDHAPPYPFHKTWDEGKLDPYMILHSRLAYCNNLSTAPADRDYMQWNDGRPKARGLYAPVLRQRMDLPFPTGRLRARTLS